MASSETGSTHCQGEGDDTEGPDFSCLPDVVWVKVLQLLDVTDRYHVTLTCSRLHALFDHPSVWSHATLELSVSYDGELKKYSDLSVLQHKRSMLQYVKVTFQKVYVPLQVMSPEEISTLLELPLSENLKSLKINLNFDIIEFQRVIENNDTAHMSSVLIELCNRAPEKLHVELELTDISVFHSKNAACEVFDSLGPKKWYQRVTSLSFPHGSLSEETQFSLYPQLTSTPTAVLVSRFPSLRSLSLNAINLSDQLLYQLADTSRSHCTLRALAIHFGLCCEGFVQEATFEVLELSSSAWGGLVSACSNLEVSCFLGEAVTLKELCSVVRPEAPVVSVEVRYRVDQGIEAFVPFCLQHSQTLKRFTYKGSSLTICLQFSGQQRDDRGGSLISMVTECPRLRHLAYIGEIHNENVVKLAELNRQWTTFVFQEKLFLFDARDKLYSPGRRGDLSPAVRAAQKEALSRMCEHVSRHLGYPWKPRHSSTIYRWTDLGVGHEQPTAQCEQDVPLKSRA